jgi:hypothetical protein
MARVAVEHVTREAFMPKFSHLNQRAIPLDVEQIKHADAHARATQVLQTARAAAAGSILTSEMPHRQYELRNLCE